VCFFRAYKIDEKNMSKKNYILGGVLLVLGLLAYLYQGPMQDWKAKNDDQLNFLSMVDISAINGIEVTKASTTVELEKSEDKWKIKGTKDFFADENGGGIAKMLEEIKMAKVELVSERSEKKSEFQVSEADGTKVKLMKSGITVGEFVVGRYGNDYASSYMAQPQAKETWLFKVSGINAIFDRSDKNAWYDKKIFALDKSKINKVRLQYPGQELIAEKKDDKWALTKPNAMTIGDGKLDKVLEVMSTLSASDIPAQKFDGTGLEKSTVIVQVTGDGLDETIMVGNDNKKEMYFAKKGSSDSIYLISKELRDSLSVKMSDLK